MQELTIRTARHFALEPDFNPDFDLKTAMAEGNYQAIYELMIEFTKYHLTQAYKEINENCELVWDNFLEDDDGDPIIPDNSSWVGDMDDDIIRVDFESIKKAYPLNNIV